LTEIRKLFGNAKTDSLLWETYVSSENCKERFAGSKVLYIFFSSQGLWNAPDPDSFSQRVISQDYYDYYNVTQSKFFAKNKFDLLFVRDIYLSWYAYGINERVDSQSALTDFLAEKSKAYDEVVAVGSSAGGYAAILFGARINADRIIVFGAQNDLAGHLEFYKDSDVYDYFDADSGRAILDLAPLIREYSGKIYYFYASRAKVDIFQFSRLEGAPCVVAFPIRSDEHGRTLLAENMLDVICASDKKMLRIAKRIEGKEIGSVGFCFLSGGIFRFSAIMIRKIYRIVFKKKPVL